MSSFDHTVTRYVDLYFCGIFAHRYYGAMGYLGKVCFG